MAVARQVPMLSVGKYSLLYLNVCLLFLLRGICVQGNINSDDSSSGSFSKTQKPTVMISILARNKAHALPHFLGHLEDLDYPKDRIALWIRTDHNVDKTAEMLREWLQHIYSQYHSVDFKADDDDNVQTGFPDAQGPLEWSAQRFTHVMKLRQESLEKARKIWADYIFFVDADNILQNNQTLSVLTSYSQTVVAPMLNSSSQYSNFWGGMDETGYYKRTPEYGPIRMRQMRGLYKVALVHSTFIINLRNEDSQHLAFYPPPEGYEGPYDDVIIFAAIANRARVPMYIENVNFYGSLNAPLDAHNTLEEETELFIFLKLEAMVEGVPFLHTKHLPKKHPPQEMLGFDQIYMINLVRRPERRERMVASLDELGLKVKIVDAVDGKELNQTYLDSLGVSMLEGFLEPYHKRPLTMGEIGCFLSHYFIWEDAAKNNYQKVLVFEDDVRFEPFFVTKLQSLLKEIEDNKLEWELIYLGRKRMWHADEPPVDGFQSLVWADYSYWTLSYMVSQQGVKKLLDQKPLGKMLPVDEYIPIMFDRHPEEKWKNQFSPRNLKGMSTSPLLVFPTHYTGENNYISDTEDSHVISEEQDHSNEDLEGKPEGPRLPNILGPDTRDEL
ncbi:procollagen galactosyltransferase 1 isoform X1 [Lingula anatina]|uniref:Procollagen galactosyltransferase 1 isoform X1 n=3 Tax=Lingula anatina TaxID=7574 RepID=A0A2R2MJN0_LINAN|nr:procollagen galactosyltransferase 1 isoform X1 [Lingula anatina]|eukprot:XP_023930277.1 procollagen galactosyltransferase 1 isoform X1 [Lingula anatina]